MIALTEKFQDIRIGYRIDDETTWTDLGQVKKYVNHFDNLKRFHRIRFQVNGISRVEAAIFRGFDILEGINEGIIE